MKSRVTLSCLVLQIAVTSVSTLAASGIEPVTANQMSAALEAWRTGDLDGAQQKLTQMIDAGTRDARVYYYRGLIAEQSGGNSDQDLRTAARLEARSGTERLSNRTLENVQGALRLKIEKYRAEARAELKPDPKGEARKLLYREGLDAYKAGDSATALARFDSVIKDGSDDPRVYYFRGVVLAETGQTDAARLAFADGLAREKSAKDIQSVNLALLDVQGSVRQMIEEQTTVEINGSPVTRQSAIRHIRSLASIAQEERLADAVAAAALDAEQELADFAVRQQKAADAILAKEKVKKEAAGNLTAPTSPAADLLAATDVPKKEIAAATPITEAADATVSINTSYLPADADFVFYVRPADILASGFIKPVKGSPEFEKGMTEMAALLGFDANDIESVTSGMSNFVGSMMQFGMLAAGGQDPTAMAQNLLGGGDGINVIRTKKDLELATLIATTKGVESSFDGKTYYLLESAQPDQPKMAFYSVDSRTCIFGVEKSIQAAIANGPGESTNEQFHFVPDGSVVVLAFSSPLLAGMSGSIPEAPPDSPPFVGQMFSAVRGKIAGAAIAMDFGSNLDLKLIVSLTEPEAASEVQGPLKQALTMAKQMYPLVGAGTVPELLQAPVNQLVNSLTASHNGSIATVAVEIPGQIVSIVKDNPDMFQGMMPMAPSGAGGAAGPPRTSQPPGFPQSN